MDQEEKWGKDDMIERLIQEEQQERKQKKKQLAPAKAKRPKTGEEEDEGYLPNGNFDDTQGGIAGGDDDALAQESTFDISKQTRTAKRQDDAELQYQAQLSSQLGKAKKKQAAQDGRFDDQEEQVMEPFNMRTEREEGTVGEDGNFTFKKDEQEEADAWLDADKAPKIAPEVLAAVLKRNEEIAANINREEEPLLLSQKAKLKGDMAQLLLQKETVAQGLRRLGSQLKEAKQREKGSKEVGGGDSQELKQIQEAFERLTDLADQLLMQGEMEIYQEAREDLASAAAFFGGSAGKDGDDDAADMFADDDDMFADKEDKPKGGSDAADGNPEQPQKQQGQGSKPPSTQAEEKAGPSVMAADEVKGLGASEGGCVAARQQEAGQAGGQDYSSWPIAELRRFLTERGESTEGIVEKSDLVERVKALAEQGPEGEEPSLQGFALDPTTGYHYNPLSQLYYDSATGYYYPSSSGNWFYYDALGTAVEVASTAE